MSTQKKDTTSQNKTSENTTNLNNIEQQSKELIERSIQTSYESINQGLDETKKNIQVNTDQARKQIPQYTQAFNELQEQTLQATNDIAQDYLEFQRQAVNSFQSVFVPYYENATKQFQNNNIGFGRIPEVYSKIANNYAENIVNANRILNDMTFSNIALFKNWVNNSKQYSKHFINESLKNLEAYQQVSKDNLQRGREYYNQ